ncbi:hypothetical protein SMACR_07138 [Sordaria macrospora]|uniref:WGS project CABT00000000 data, contig 2.39 n=2 Tax=Sordaria macrospora TaxID=5147 RepID=F7W7G2_SORMK|nr:uncharacterized protein SMAC_07138 [Sordaria macrospora k-hell]KAA8633436.1 hypothetical protein SMACR_07138 [Sordaria macrospora]WPJ66939.1 hypothetical protein SMAC4_07138 [Sordaria macrospora]CCC13513.1 unnamed protein product [Sordaria macrospora k-hell]
MTVKAKALEKATYISNDDIVRHLEGIKKLEANTDLIGLTRHREIVEMQLKEEKEKEKDEDTRNQKKIDALKASLENLEAEREKLLTLAGYPATEA